MTQGCTPALDQRWLFGRGDYDYHDNNDADDDADDDDDYHDNNDADDDADDDGDYHDNYDADDEGEMRNIVMVWFLWWWWCFIDDYTLCILFCKFDQ